MPVSKASHACGGTATQTWQRFKSPRKEELWPNAFKKLHNRHWAKAKPTVSRHTVKHFILYCSRTNSVQNRVILSFSYIGQPLHTSDRNSQATSITALMYWIQYVSYVLFKWQTSINNWCSSSIIILATLVTWSPSPLPTQGNTLQGTRDSHWNSPSRWTYCRRNIYSL